MFVVLRTLVVHGANALSCPLLVGYPTLTAYHGYACTATRRLAQELGVNLQPKGLVVVHHGGQLRAHGQHRNRLTQKRYVHDAYPPPDPDRRDYYFSPSGSPMPELDLTASLLVQIQADFPLGPALSRLEREAVDFVMGPKAFGGTVQSHGGLHAAGTLEEALRLAPAGHLLGDRSFELMHPDRDPLDRLLDLLRNRAAPYRQLAPVQIGWRGVTPLVERETPRGRAAHAFVEPLIGLAEFIRASTATVADQRSALWHPRIHRDANLFLLETNAHGPDTSA